MRKILFMLLVLLVSACGEWRSLEVEVASPWTVPLSLLPDGADAPAWQIERLNNYVRTHRAAWGPYQSKGGDDAQNCENAGPPQCRRSYCTDVCGRHFWQLSDDTCVGQMSGKVYPCDGFAH